MYGRSETTQSLNKKTSQTISSIFNTIHNSSQKNTLLKSTPEFVPSVGGDVEVVVSPTNIVQTIEASSGEIALNLGIEGIGGFRLPNIDGDVILTFEGIIPTDKFVFTLEMGFVHVPIPDEDGNPTNDPEIVFPDAAMGIPAFESSANTTVKLDFNTLDRGLTWSVSNSINIFGGLDLGEILAGVRAWIEGLPVATEDSGILQVFPTEPIGTKIIKGLAHEGIVFINSIAKAVTDWLNDPDSNARDFRSIVQICK